jgi:hypothetical protein
MSSKASHRRRELHHRAVRRQRRHSGQSAEFHFERDQAEFKSPKFGETAAKVTNSHNLRACGLFPQHIAPKRFAKHSAKTLRQNWSGVPSQ